MLTTCVLLYMDTASVVGARPKDLVYIVEIALLCNLSYLTIIDSITSMVKKNLSFFSVAHISFFVFQARKVFLVEAPPAERCKGVSYHRMNRRAAL